MNIQSRWLLPAVMCAGILATNTAAAAQLRPGDRVRVYPVSQSTRFVGTIMTTDETTITIAADQDGRSTVLRREDIATLDVCVGETSRSKHVLTGAAIGGGLGAVIGLASGDEEYIAFSAGEKALVLGVAFGVVGTVVGLALPAGEQWRHVPLNSQVSIDPAHGSVGCSVAYRF